MLKRGKNKSISIIAIWLLLLSASFLFFYRYQNSSANPMMFLYFIFSGILVALILIKLIPQEKTNITLSPMRNTEDDTTKELSFAAEQGFAESNTFHVATGIFGYFILAFAIGILIFEKLFYFQGRYQIYYSDWRFPAFVTFQLFALYMLVRYLSFSLTLKKISKQTLGKELILTRDHLKAAGTVLSYNSQSPLMAKRLPYLVIPYSDIIGFDVIPPGRKNAAFYKLRLRTQKDTVVIFRACFYGKEMEIIEFLRQKLTVDIVVLDELH